jgi:hypothetical protein
MMQNNANLPELPDLAQQASPSLPGLKRLQNLEGEAANPSPAQSTGALEDQELQEDIEKLRRIGFIR